MKTPKENLGGLEFEAHRVHFNVFFNSVLNRKKTDCQRIEKHWKSQLGTGNIVVNKFAVEGATVKACCDWLNKARSFEPSLCAKSAYQTHNE